MAINPEILVGSHEQDYVRRAINGAELVDYSIFGNSSLAEGYSSTVKIGWNKMDTIYAHNHDSHHIDFIRSVFDRLDPLLDIDFVERGEAGSSDINIFRSWYNSYYDEVDLLSNDPSDIWGGGTAHYDHDNVDIAWLDYYEDDPFVDSEKMTIVHEIGHALGLLDLGYNPLWDTYDSIMSYNHPNNLPMQTWFTEADIKAMQSIWGLEDDLNSIDGGTTAVHNGYTVDNNNIVTSSDISALNNISSSQPDHSMTAIHSSINNDDASTNASNDSLTESYSSFIIEEVPVDISEIIKASGKGSEMVEGSNKDDIIGFGRGAYRLFGNRGKDIFIFNRKDDFGAKAANQIIDFNPAKDQLLIAKKALKGIGNNPEFVTASSRKEMKSLRQEAMEIVYFEPKGQLYYNQNDEGKGFGKKGGLFAILNGSPELSEDNIGLLGG